jgi:hypothetical protein
MAVRRLIPTAAVAVFHLLVVCDGVLAQEAVTLRSEFTFFGDNTEFSTRFREGETLAGVYARLYLDVDLGAGATLRAGIFANQRFGDTEALDRVWPVATLILTKSSSSFLFGTLDTVPRDGPGPDRTTPHGLLPPLQVETLSFTRPYEAGLQWKAASQAGRQEVWLAWQRLNTPEEREQFDAGIVGLRSVNRWLALGYQLHVVHHGGQLFASGPVSDSYAYAGGAAASRRLPLVGVTTAEVYGAVSRYVPDREARPPRTDGAGLFARLSAERAGWRGHLILWRGNDFIKEEGDPNYLSIDRRGVRIRKTRDYGELGLTRHYRPVEGLSVEVSGRLHRVESDYEYSYRVLATTKLGLPLKRRTSP